MMTLSVTDLHVLAAATVNARSQIVYCHNPNKHIIHLCGDVKLCL